MLAFLQCRYNICPLAGLADNQASFEGDNVPINQNIGVDSSMLRRVSFVVNALGYA